MINHTVILLSFLFMLTPASAAFGSEDEGRGDLPAQQKALAERIEMLKHEQDFLLFQKTAFAADSKYLILSLGDGRGQFRYKNKILKDVRFKMRQRDAGRLKQGVVILSGKIESPPGRQALIFGKGLVLLIAGGRTAFTDVPVLFLGKRDFNSLFYALENGAQAYILP
ncbi:MAG: hypothetical protein A2010_00800 [Nitrospirae bacterium GWD2_57_9]|nr:MAG: hypothetical protein A2010_00800 [Nitrospirae bacterium GWD2_57_9]